jgi:hypothetical protein
MQANEKFSQLTGDIYDAALDPSLWPRALEKTAAFVGGRGAGLFARDPTRKTGNMQHVVGINPRYSQTYFDDYIKLDPLSAAYLALDVGESDRLLGSRSPARIRRDTLLPGVGPAARLGRKNVRDAREVGNDPRQPRHSFPRPP